MEKNIEQVLTEFEDRLKTAEEMIKKFDEQAEKRLDARMREKELEARILEAKLAWRPKDWFILSGILSALAGFLAVLAVVLVLAFSYVPSTTTTMEGVLHKPDITAVDDSTVENSANFTIQ